MFTCAVNGEDEEEHAGDQVPQESDHAAGDAFGDGVHRFDEELEEDRHAAVDENAHQDAGGVEDGCKKTTTTGELQLYGKKKIQTNGQLWSGSHSCSHHLPPNIADLNESFSPKQHLD